ncbi:hypothetical protein Tco_1184554 [Tanacetum coccineum]
MGMTVMKAAYATIVDAVWIIKWFTLWAELGVGFGAELGAEMGAEMGLKWVLKWLRIRAEIGPGLGAEMGVEMGAFGFPAQVSICIKKFFKALEEDAFRPFWHHYDGSKVVLNSQSLRFSLRIMVCVYKDTDDDPGSDVRIVNRRNTDTVTPVDGNSVQDPVRYKNVGISDGVWVNLNLHSHSSPSTSVDTEPSELNGRTRVKRLLKVSLKDVTIFALFPLTILQLLLKASQDKKFVEKSRDNA